MPKNKVYTLHIDILRVRYFVAKFYVAGCFLDIVLADLSIQPINRSVIFLK